MKTIIAGSRTITDMSIVKRAIEESGFDITTVISGCAKGVDLLAIQWAVENGLPVMRFSPAWGQFRRAAGPISNKEMAHHADACIVIWDGKSLGTKNMIDVAQKRNLALYVHRI